MTARPCLVLDWSAVLKKVRQWSDVGRRRGEHESGTDREGRRKGNCTIMLCVHLAECAMGTFQSADTFAPTRWLKDLTPLESDPMRNILVLLTWCDFYHSSDNNCQFCWNDGSLVLQTHIWINHCRKHDYDDLVCLFRKIMKVFSILLSIYK